MCLLVDIWRSDQTDFSCEDFRVFHSGSAESAAGSRRWGGWTFAPPAASAGRWLVHMLKALISGLCAGGWRWSFYARQVDPSRKDLDAEGPRESDGGVMDGV